MSSNTRPLGLNGLGLLLWALTTITQAADASRVCAWDSALVADHPLCVPPVEPTRAAPSLAFIPEAEPDPCDAFAVTHRCGDGVLHCPKKQAELIRAWAKADAGDAICAKGAAHGGPRDNVFHCATPNNGSCYITRHAGTGEQPIVFGEWPGDEIVLRGSGSAERYDNGTCATCVGNHNQNAFRFDHDNWHVHGVRIEWFGEAFATVCGSGIEMHDVDAQYFWRFGVQQGGGDCQEADGDGVIDGFLFSHSRLRNVYHGSGLGQVPSRRTSWTVANMVGQYSYLGQMGIDSLGRDVPIINGDPAGGGNSDGAGQSTHTCPLPDANGVPQNRCKSLTLRHVFIDDMSDDAVDTSGFGLTLEGVIMVNCAPEGAKCVKVKSTSSGIDARLIGNFAHGDATNTSVAYETRVGAGFKMDVYANNGAYFIEGYDSPTQSTSKVTNPKGHMITEAEVDAGRLVNNLGIGTLSNFAGSKMASDWDAATDGDPKLMGPIGSVLDLDRAAIDDPNLTPKQRLEAMIWQVSSKYAPRPGSPLIDAGVKLPGMHCDTGYDDPVNPNPGLTCWPYAGAGPDIGPLEYGIHIRR